jgi:hypothetical protein
MTAVEIFLGTSLPKGWSDSFFCPDLSAADCDRYATFAGRGSVTGPGVRKEGFSGTFPPGGLFANDPLAWERQH